MLYLAIDQHSMQLTYNLRNEKGDIVRRGQVGTSPEKIVRFLTETSKLDSEGYLTILEVCGFNDWLVQLLPKYGCKEVVLIQPDDSSTRKTDRRDANKLCEQLWMNRHRVREGKRPQNLRRIWLPSKEDAANRQLTQLRCRLSDLLTATLNRIHHIMFKHNIQHDRPTKGLKTIKMQRWLETIELPTIDRLEMDTLLESWKMLARQQAEVNRHIQVAQQTNTFAMCVATVPGISHYGSLTIASRLADGIDRFPTGNALANFWGLTPGCRNSGNKTNRIGGITKVGSSIVRRILGNAVTMLVRKDPWMKQQYQRIKARRGAKIARVAIMRKLATIIWRMLTNNEPYRIGGPSKVKKQRELLQGFTPKSDGVTDS